MTREAIKPRWTKREVALLVRHYPIGGVAAAWRAGIDREATAIRSKASKLGVHVEQFDVSELRDAA